MGNFDSIPIWVLFAVTIVIVVMAIEAGYRVGSISSSRKRIERSEPLETIVSAILGLLAFVLAFTFGIVASRLDARTSLVREEASAIASAYMYADLLPEAYRSGSRELIKEYLDIRLEVFNSVKASHRLDAVRRDLSRVLEVKKQLWDIAVKNAHEDMGSSYGPLYMDSLTEMFRVQAMRVAVALYSRVSFGIWLVLYSIMILGMFGVGYQTSVSGSSRSWIKPVLAVAFSILVVLIAMLDRPQSGYIMVSQQSLIDLRASMDR